MFTATIWDVAVAGPPTSGWAIFIHMCRLEIRTNILAFIIAQVFTATIWDVAVAPAYQRLGLGRALVERLTARLVDDGIPTITLYAEPKVRCLTSALLSCNSPPIVAAARHSAPGTDLR